MIVDPIQDTITKTIAATPSADAGTDITISQGATADLSGITTNASSVLWTVTSGNGTSLIQLLK